MGEPNGEPNSEPDSGATPWPFIGAVAIVGVALLGIGALTLSNRGPDADRDAVVRAALGQNDALQRLDYADFRANTCAQEAGTEADVLARQRNSLAAKGARYVSNVTAVSVDGDRATADVSYYFASAKDVKAEVATTFVREDGAWRMCTPGPV